MYLSLHCYRMEFCRFFFFLNCHIFFFFLFRDGHVSLQEYMAFMISRETENVQSSSEVEQAFRALTSGEKPYITAQELYAVSYGF